MNDINIVEYNSKDRKSCIDLLKRTFPGTSDDGTFCWRFESRSRHSPLIICAKDKDKIVSFNSWIPWEFVHNDHTYLAYQSGESATYEEYRGKGIWGRVLRYADQVATERNIDFLYGFPSTMSYRAFYKADYCPIGIFNYRLRLINPFIKNEASKTDYNFDDFPPQTLYEKNKITPMNDADYFEWRYLKNSKHYDVIKYVENNNQALFIVNQEDYFNKRFRVKICELLLLDCHFTSYNQIFMENAFKYLDQIYSGKVFYIKTFLNENTDRGRAICKHFHIRFKLNTRFMSRCEILCIKIINQNLDYSVFFNYNNWDIFPHVIDEM
jgi:GNAT superfamily N-acetyltransferase